MSIVDQAIPKTILGPTLLVTALGLFSLGIAAIVRRPATAIVLVAGMLLVPAILGENLGPTAGGWLVAPSPVSGFSVLAVYDYVVTPTPPRVVDNPGADYLPTWAGFGVLCAWVVLALGVAAWRLRRRDA